MSGIEQKLFELSFIFVPLIVFLVIFTVMERNRRKKK